MSSCAVKDKCHARPVECVFKGCQKLPTITVSSENTLVIKTALTDNTFVSLPIYQDTRKQIEDSENELKRVRNVGSAFSIDWL